VAATALVLLELAQPWTCVPPPENSAGVRPSLTHPSCAVRSWAQASCLGTCLSAGAGPSSVEPSCLSSLPSVPSWGVRAVGSAGPSTSHGPAAAQTPPSRCHQKSPDVLRTPRQGHGDAVTSSVPEAEEFERTLRVGRGSDLEDRDVTCCRLQLWHVLCAYVSVCARAS
jgi:hypothetical protein